MVLCISRSIIGVLALLFVVNTDAGSLRHPGILHSREELEFVKEKIRAGAQPWKQAFDQMKSSRLASLAYLANPFVSVDCGSYNNPNHGCDEIHDDGAAAYTHALLWVLTGNQAHADKSKSIILAWSRTYRTNTLSNSRLVIGWAAPFFVNAAELLRYTPSGWVQADTEIFDSMLDRFMPWLKIDSLPENNWIQSMMEAQMAIAVFQDDTQELASAVKRWQHYLPIYIYQKSDGPLPVKAPWRTDPQVIQIWQAPLRKNVLVDGQAMETCRDLGHLGMGFGSMIYAAETAWKQGFDLFSPNAKRLRDFMELHGSWMTGSVQVPATVCDGVVKTNQNNTEGINAPRGGGEKVWEIAYNHLGVRLGAQLPFTRRMIAEGRPTGVQGWVAKWETLTFGEVPVKEYIASPIKPGIQAERSGRLFQGEWNLTGRWIPAPKPLGSPIRFATSRNPR